MRYMKAKKDRLGAGTSEGGKGNDCAYILRRKNGKVKRGGSALFYSDDPVLDAERYQAALDKEEEALPRCSICDEPVKDGYFYNINDEVVCADCLEHHYRVEVEDYIA